jgi:hypothetical protein
MLLIIEIILTGWACSRFGKAKKGWAWGLLPIGIGLALGVLIGLIVGVTGGTVASVSGLLLFFDFVMIAALIWMIAAVKPAATK